MTAYQVGLQRIAMTVVSDAPGYVQLSHPWFPASQVRINGLPVAPIEGAIDLTVVPIDAGENAIEIGPVVTPVRTISTIVSAVFMALAFAVAGGLGLKRGSPDANGS